MPWFRVDDKLHGHRKWRRAGKAAIGVWVAAGSWSMDHLTDGFVPAEQLSAWGTRGDAKRLVEAELWDLAEKDGEQGWQFRNWLEFQPSAAEVEADRAKARERMRRLRSGERSGEHGTDVRANVRENFSGSSTTPSPIPTSVVTSSRHLESVPGGLTGDDLDRIAAAVAGDRPHAAKVAADILSRASTVPRDAVAYVLRSVGDDPDRYRPTHRPPMRAEECPDHPGQYATACGGCAADRKAAR